MSDSATSPRWDALWLGASLATFGGDAPYGEIEDGALAVRGDTIAWVGGMRDLPGEPATLAKEVHDASGSWILPGLIDCHTHLVWGGSRANEFEERLLGASYAEIARRGGGILSTVRATREAGEEELLARAEVRASRLAEEGVTTLEVKSGYGLDLATETKCLRVARELGRIAGLDVVTTFLGAHAVPPEYAGRADDYVDLVCEEMLPAVAEEGLADAVDGFCEGIAFSPAQIERVFERAGSLGLPVKLHAEQLSNLGGAALAARHGALSADHLEYLDEPGARAMAEAGTTAVLLPGAFYTLRETRVPPVEVLRRVGVPIAVATDCNPGSSPLASLLLVVNMACTLFRLTPEEALAGVTREAAGALGLTDRGILAAGRRADFGVWAIDRPAALAYEPATHRPRTVIHRGRAL